MEIQQDNIYQSIKEIIILSRQKLAQFCLAGNLLADRQNISGR